MVACSSLVELHPAAFEKGQQRTWDHIPKRNCMWDNKKTKQKRRSLLFSFFPVEMRNTSQVTNQSSHGELSFHHNPHPPALLGLVPLYSSRYSERGHKIETCSSPTYCHCCEFCALKQKPGVLLAKKYTNKKHQIPTVDRTHHRIRSPSIKCSGT